VPVYKPPLFPYLVAGTQLAFGPLDLGLRVPGLAAGLLTVVLSAALARALYQDRWLAGPAAVVAALSPFATQFSATLFPDPLMAVLGLGACVAAARRRAMLAGLLAGLSLAAKQTGLAWVPLACILVLIREPNRLRSMARLLAGFAAPLGLVYAWDAVRSMQGATSFWDVGISGYGGLRLIWPHELATRLAGWGRLAGYLVVSPALNMSVLVGVSVLSWVALRHMRCTAAGLTDLALVGFGVTLMLVHWLCAFPVWDRYLLPLAPLVSVLISRVARLVSQWADGQLERVYARRVRTRGDRHGRVTENLSQVIVQAALVMMLVGPTVGGSDATSAIGGDHGASQGIDEVAQYIAGLPEGSVVYHHWQGWHYGYYLFDVPVFLAYWPDPSWLAADVRTFGASEPRYVTFPAAESTTRVEHGLHTVGYGLHEELTTRNLAGMHTFSLYRIVPLEGA
jgi:4-amino-4-deoxy-L-arabinose transferase-like glycosyltransferase